MIILGVDPGSRLLGYGCIEKTGNHYRVITHGTVQLYHKEYKNVPVDETTPSRLKEIHEKLSEIIQTYRPQAMAVEKVFFAKNAVSALKLGQARGVVLLTGALHDLEIYEYSATEVKGMVTGYGRADKDQVAKTLQLILGQQEFQTQDSSDALAIALAHGLSMRGGAAKVPEAKSGKSRKSGSLKSLAESIKNR
jgi:crossover junction endodeoxyribonuclease RuvC